MMKWPPARRAYGSESATADSTSIAARPFGRTMNRAWPPAPLPARRLPGRRVEPTPRRENLARYIIRASLPARASQWQAGFSQERMTYIAADDSADGTAKVLYESKDGKATKTFGALDWPALLNRVLFREI